VTWSLRLEESGQEDTAWVDVLAEGISLKAGRLVWQKFEQLARDFLAAVLEAAETDAAFFARFAMKSA